MTQREGKSGGYKIGADHIRPTDRFCIRGQCDGVIEDQLTSILWTKLISNCKPPTLKQTGSHDLTGTCVRPGQAVMIYLEFSSCSPHDHVRVELQFNRIDIWPLNFFFWNGWIVMVKQRATENRLKPFYTIWIDRDPLHANRRVDSHILFLLSDVVRHFKKGC